MRADRELRQISGSKTWEQENLFLLLKHPLAKPNYASGADGQTHVFWTKANIWYITSIGIREAFRTGQQIDTEIPNPNPNKWKHEIEQSYQAS